jgi:hypothetical protein
MRGVVLTFRIRIVKERGPTRKTMTEGFDEPKKEYIHGLFV